MDLGGFSPCDPPQPPSPPIPHHGVEVLPLLLFPQLPGGPTQGTHAVAGDAGPPEIHPVHLLLGPPQKSEVPHIRICFCGFSQPPGAVLRPCVDFWTQISLESLHPCFWGVRLCPICTILIFMFALFACGEMIPSTTAPLKRTSVTRFRVRFQGGWNGDVSLQSVAELVQRLGRKQFHVQTLVVSEDGCPTDGNGRGLTGVWWACLHTHHHLFTVCSQNNVN